MHYSVWRGRDFFFDQIALILDSVILTKLCDLIIFQDCPVDTGGQIQVSFRYSDKPVLSFPKKKVAIN